MIIRHYIDCWVFVTTVINKQRLKIFYVQQLNTIIIISSNCFVCFFGFRLSVNFIFFLLRAEPPFFFWARRRKVDYAKPLRLPKPELQSSSSPYFVLLHVFSQCKHHFIDNPMIITDHNWARRDMLKAIRPGFETISEIRVARLNKDLTVFMHRLSPVRQNRANEIIKRSAWRA